MLKLNNVSIETRHPITKNLSFSFNRNMIYGIIAPNGQGKTTLFRCITGLEKIVNGQILLEGESVYYQRKKIFYLETTNWIDQNLNCHDHLSFVKKAWQSKIELKNVIQKCQLQEFSRIPIRKCSLGMKQRLIFGMYMISDADYLLYDEILNGLDSDSRDLFIKEILALRNAGKMVIITSHYQNELMKFCDQILFLKDLKLIGSEDIEL